MRNLKLVQERVTSLPGISGLSCDFDGVVVSLGPSASNPIITLKRLPGDATSHEDAETIASWDADGSDRVLDLHCFPDIRTTSLILANGDIVLVRQEPSPGEEQIEIVGSVDAGISAAAWSPDEELVAIATKADTLLVMTRDFEPTANIPLSTDDVKVSHHVSVGWGKKETQFKGRGVAKTLRDPTMPEHVDEGTVSPLDDGTVSLSWRGDGQYLAMNSILESEPRRRIIRVYSREGVLESASEPVNGLEAALSWKPSGQTIAGIQRTDTGVQVVFFERNGLRHGEFDLRLTKEQSETVGRNISLTWNVDSTVLGITMSDRVQLWTTGNYHWYLKQEILFRQPDGDHNRPHLIWNRERPLQLICSSDHKMQLLDYNFSVARGPVTPPNDLGLVAVIDGKTLKVTPLRLANVPPPMAFDEIALPETAASVIFNDAGNEITVLHANGETTVWTCNYSAKPVKRASLKSRSQQDEAAGDRALSSHRSGKLLNGDRIAFSQNGVLSISGASSTRINGVTSYLITQSHLIYTTSNHLLKFVHLRDDGELRIPLDEPEKDERCRNIERGAKIVTAMPSAHSLVLQMPRGNLETIYPRALVLAGIRQSITNRDYKKAFRTCRTHRVDMNILHDYAPDQFMRDVPLFLKQVKKPEHVDLFLSSLSEENVADTIYMETLISRSDLPLLNGRTVEEAPSGDAPKTVSKVNGICDAFLRELRDRTVPSLQNIITAHVCRNPPDLQAGLLLVSELRKQERQSELEAVVEHICFLADVNQLYDTALSLYELEVALLVAQQSQKDPREYLPYLQSLHSMQPLRQRFAVDNDLKQYRKALSHLHALDVFDELKSYMAKHELYSAAIELYRYDNAKLTELMRMYAEFLSSRNRYKESGIAYEYVQDYSSAYQAYRSANLWQECLAAAALVPIMSDELAGLATDLAASLEEAKDFKAAAAIHLEYLADLETAAKMLCKGYHFSEAMRLVAKQGSPELLRSIIDPGLIEASAAITEMLAEMKTQLNAQVPRLRDLREKKVEDPMAFLDGADGGDDDIPDNLSLAPTNASTTGTFMTRYTNRSSGTLATNATRKTSKNRRREERKRARGKKGTVYEEEYLVNSIARLVERLNSTSDDVGRLAEALMRRAMRERAVAVDAAMQDVMGICKASLDEVFATTQQQSGPIEPQEVNGTSASRPWGGQGVLWEAMNTSTQGHQAPLLKAFERLSLLS